MRRKKILVTGGMGYIGSHTIVELISKGYEAIIIDNLSNSQESVLQGIEKITGNRPQFYNLDLCEEEKVKAFFSEHKDLFAIIHFAALKAVGDSVNKPLIYYKNNLNALLNILQFKNENSGIIFSSSCTVYGQPDNLPVSEESPLKLAESPYGNTKRIAEEILIDAVKANGKAPVISLRYFNPIGSHESAEIGELPLGIPNNLMPFITQTAAGIRKELKVFGNDYKTPDGTAIRDYIHVVDLAKAHVAALERIINNKYKENYEVFNIGTGKGFSVLEVIQSFERTTGVKLNYSYTDRRAGDIEMIYGNVEKAKIELGWKTKLDLDDMTRSAWNWQKKLG